jgi:beta-lactamase regulating signal transducer with metallopeptidase domain
MMPVILVLAKVTCVLLAALAATLAMARASAGTRHLVWLVALLALLALPALDAWGPLPLRVLPEAAVLASPPPSAPSSDRAVDEGAPAATLSAARAPVTGDVPAVSRPASRGGAPLDLELLLLLAWPIVALALLVRLGYGAYAVRRIVRRAVVLEHPEWQQPLYEIADRLGLTAAPRLLRSEDVKMPFAAGLVAATIVLPADSDDWSAERRTAVLIHELGHIRRRDLVGHTVGRIACALYWFHPLVWTAARRLRAESERACDDLALLFGARPSDYAEHLLDIVTGVRDHYTPSVALALAHRKEFEGRMLAILDPGLRRRGPSRAQAVSLVGSLALLALLVGAAAPLPRVAQASSAQAADTARSAMPAPSAAATPAPAPAATPVVVPATRPSAAPASRAEPAGPASTGRPAARTTGSPASGVGQAAKPASGTEEPDDQRATVLAKTLRTDSSAGVRRVAAWGLHQYADLPVAVEALAAASAGDADASVREMAVWALAEAEPGPATAALVKAMRQDRDPKVRATAVWALGSIGDPAAVEALAGVLSDADASLRELAAWSIGSCEPNRAPAALVAALADRERDVRESVAWALYQIEDADAAGALDAALRRETDPEVQRGLIKALGASGEGSVDALQRLVASPDPAVRDVAVRALAGGNASGPWPWPRPEPRPFP